MTNYEIERKWLILGLPKEINLENLKNEKILQGYFTDDGGRGLRLRQKGGKYYKTHKTPTDNPTKRVEDELEIDEAEFKKNWSKTEGKQIQKTRYYIDQDGHTIELDVFEGLDSGKMTAEVEFDSLEDAKAFLAPSWFGEEVTADKRYGNAEIAVHGFPEVT